MSGLGKGVTASSIGVLLKACGHRVTSIKIGMGGRWERELGREKEKQGPRAAATAAAVAAAVVDKRPPLKKPLSSFEKNSSK